MTRPAQPDLFQWTPPLAQAAAPIEAEGVTYEFTFVPGPECAPRDGVVIPEWLRFPGEEGYVELDRYFRVVSK